MEGKKGFTPEPWTYDGLYYVLGSDGKKIAEMYERYDGSMEANAKLITSAPELYRLLKEAVDCIEYNFKGQDDVADFWIKEAKDALRIASGENV